MTFIRLLIFFKILLIYQCYYAANLMAAEPKIHLDNATILKLYLKSSTPADNSAFLKKLKGYGKRCRAPKIHEWPGKYAICKSQLLSGLVSLKHSSNEVLVATLNWYWSSKSRISANEGIQKRLFNQLQSPLLDAIMIEQRYLQSAMEYSNIQFRLNPESKKYWDKVPTRQNNQSIMELFQLSYNLPTWDRAYAGGFINQERYRGSAARYANMRTELNRSLSHILSFVGKNPTLSSRRAIPPIPNNDLFWKTLDSLGQPTSNAAWQQQVTPLENQLKQLSDVYTRWLQLTPKVDDMFRSGKAKIFIEYIVYNNIVDGQNHYAVFSLSSDNPRASLQFIDLGPASTISKYVAKLRQAILRKSPLVKLEQQLTKLLIKPLSINFDNISEIVIAPAGTLNAIPFSLLLDKTVLISYSNRWSILTQQFWRQAKLKQQTKTTPGIILANPDYGGQLKSVTADLNVAGLERDGSNSWPRFFAPLTYTAQEGKVIKKLSPDKVLLLSGKNASEFSLFERNNPKFIHIASHGYFLSDDWQRTKLRKINPRRADMWYIAYPWVLSQLNSGLALAGANQLIAGTDVAAFEQDGLFTASDAASLNLLGTELVVLSACNTGLGSVVDNQQYMASIGDGASNLRSAFRQAGAKNVIMSLWPVADKPTAWIMAAFYRAWFSGMEPKQALTRAKSHLRERLRKNAMSDHPYYWAGFVIQSEF